MKTRYHAPALAALLSLLTGVGCHTVQARAAFKDGNRFYKEENWRRAIEQYEKALAHDPDYAEAHFYLASASRPSTAPARRATRTRRASSRRSSTTRRRSKATGATPRTCRRCGRTPSPC